MLEAPLLHCLWSRLSNCKWQNSASYQPFFVLSLPVFLYIHRPLSVTVCHPFFCHGTDRRRYALQLQPQTLWRTTWRDSVCCQTLQIRLTLKEPSRTWDMISVAKRPSTDRSPSIQTDRGPSKGDLSMCQLLSSWPQITSLDQARGI